MPDTTSVMILEYGCSMVACYGNNLSAKSSVVNQNTASAGVEPYGNNWDFCVDNNTFTYVQTAISNWAQGQNTPLGFQPDNWNLFCNNTMNYNRTAFDQLMGFYSNSGYNPGIVAFGNVFRNNQINGAGTMVKCIAESNAQWISAGVPIDECIFEHNTATNIPWGVDLNDQSLGSQGTNALFYKNSFSLGTATYSGSMGANIPAGHESRLPAGYLERLPDHLFAQSSGRHPRAAQPRADRQHHPQRQYPAGHHAGMELRHQRVELDGDLHHRQLAHPVARQRHRPD